jgi:hypothetical protein
MKSFTTWLLVASAAANPISKRQAVTPAITDDEIALITTGGPRLAQFLGSGDVASKSTFGSNMSSLQLTLLHKAEKISAFAQLMGAGPESAGSVGKLFSDQMNGWST